MSERWARPFKRIVLTDGRAIASLAEARDCIALLSSALQLGRHWIYASELLVRAAGRNEKYSTMDARAQMLRALRIDGLVAPKPSTREDPLRLLVIENDAKAALGMTEHLVELGYLVAGPACCFNEARRLATIAQIDGALLDRRLGGISTDGVADILARRRIPFFFVVGGDKIPSSAYDEIVVLRKPFSKDDLRRTIESALRAA
jgi:hypothetical protein